MNFDFAEREETCCGKVDDVFDADAKAALAELAKGDTQQSRNIFLRFAKSLYKIGYFLAGPDGKKNDVGIARAQHQLARSSPSLFLSVEYSNRIFGRLLAVYGTSDQNREILAALNEGKIVGAVALSEGTGGIGHNPLFTCQRIDSDSFRISGSKEQVVNGPIADWIAIEGWIEERPAFFLIEKNTKGFFRGPRLCMLGYHQVSTCAISIENCLVHSKHVIGPFTGTKLSQVVRTWENQLLTAASIGLMQRCYETAVAYAKKQVNKGKPLIAQQEVGFKVAEMLTLLQTSQLLAYRSAWTSETGNSEADLLSYCAKVFCTEAAENVASWALQVLGEDGYLAGNPVEEAYRDAKYLQISGTSVERSRMVIAEEILERLE